MDVSLAQTESFISASPFFEGLSRDACHSLARVARERSFGKRETLFLEGEPGTEMYLLVSGIIQLTKSDPSGTETVLRTVREGEAFAEVVLFEIQRYPVTATALGDARVLAIAGSDVRNLLGNGDFRGAFLAFLMQRLRHLADRVRYLGSYDAEQRLLLFLREQYGTGKSLTVDLAKKDIAAAIGTAPETFSRLLNRLREDELLTWERKRVSVSDRLWARIQDL